MDKKSVKMSEIFRKWLWSLLLAFALVLLLAGLLPLKSPEPQVYSARGTGAVSLDSIRHLPSDDLSNQGDAEALAMLPGIGPAIAQRLILERDENGVFHYPEDLTAVKGIGEIKLEQIRPFLTVMSDERDE